MLGAVTVATHLRKILKDSTWILLLADVKDVVGHSDGQADFDLLPERQAPFGTGCGYVPFNFFREPQGAFNEVIVWKSCLRGPAESPDHSSPDYAPLSGRPRGMAGRGWV